MFLLLQRISSLRKVLQNYIKRKNHILSLNNILCLKYTIVMGWMDAIKSVIFITTVSQIGRRKRTQAPAVTVNWSHAFTLNVKTTSKPSGLVISSSTILREKYFGWLEARLITVEFLVTLICGGTFFLRIKNDFLWPNVPLSLCWQHHDMY